MSECPNCKTQFKLQLLDQDLGKTESTCPNCHTEITFYCNNCANTIQVKDNYECTWCGFFICPTCHSCSLNCTGREKFNYIIERIKIEEDQSSILGFPNFKTFKHYQLIGTISKLNVKRVCPRGVWYTSAHSHIPRLVGITEGWINQKDKAEYESRLNKIFNYFGNTQGLEFNIDDIKEAGRDGKEEKDIVELSICKGLVQINSNYNQSKKLYSVKPTTTCPFFIPPSFEKKKECKLCKSTFSFETLICPKCPPYKKGIKKGKSVELKQQNVRSSDIRTCACPINQFIVKKVGDKNRNDKSNR